MRLFPKKSKDPNPRYISMRLFPKKAKTQTLSMMLSKKASRRRNNSRQSR